MLSSPNNSEPAKQKLKIEASFILSVVAVGISSIDKARDIALKTGISFVYIGNVPSHLAENTFCHKCKRMVIERKGFIILKNDIAAGKCKFCGDKIPGGLEIGNKPTITA